MGSPQIRIESYGSIINGNIVTESDQVVSSTTDDTSFNVKGNIK